MTWRWGATSFVYPAGWLDNVQRLGDRVDDIELLFFAIEGPDGLPDAAEVRGLVEAKRAFGLTYSVHTPLAASLASADGARRQAGVDLVCRSIAAARPLGAEHFVLHVYLGDGEHDPAPPTDLRAWRARAAASLQAIVQRAQVAPAQLCVESLDYDFAHLEPVVEALGLSVALDVGHLWRDGRDVAPVLARNWERLALLQVHGTDPTGRDHRDLHFAPRAQVRELGEALRQGSFAGVVTLEVFAPDDFVHSLALAQTL